MKKIVALILAAVLLCSCAVALADSVPPVPNLDTFAAMTTKTKDNVMRVTLSKPVDKLYINWPNELQVVELSVTEDLKAAVLLAGQNTQPGVAELYTLYIWDDKAIEFPIATKEDRAFVTVQGDWIVCYNRKGAIVAVAYAKDADIQAVRDVAFEQFRKPATGILVIPVWDD